LVLVACEPTATLPVTSPCGAGGPAASWQMQFGGESFGVGAPAVADLDGDGAEEVVVAGRAGIVRVLRADGTLLWERPVVVTPGAAPSAVEGTPAIGNLDSDSIPEIVVPAGSWAVPGQPGGVVVFDVSGNVKWTFAPPDSLDAWFAKPGPDGLPEPVFGSPAIGDVNGDLVPDVVVGAMDLNIWALDGRNGLPLPGWPFRIDDAVYGSPAVLDTDGNGRAEVYLGAASTPGAPIDHAGGVVVALEQAPFNGPVATRWARFTPDVIWSSPAVGDIDGDGRVEVVVGSGLDYGSDGNLPASRSLFAWHVDDGSDVTGWPVVLDTSSSTVNDSRGSPALGDLDGDGRADVVTGDRSAHVTAFRGDGSRLWPVQPEPGSGEILGGPIVADLDGDGAQDVSVAVAYGVYRLKGRTGAVIDRAINGQFQNTPALVHDPSGWRLVAAGTDALSAVGVSVGGRVDWPQWRSNPAHTGRHRHVTPTGGSPCWT